MPSVAEPCGAGEDIRWRRYRSANLWHFIRDGLRCESCCRRRAIRSTKGARVRNRFTAGGAATDSRQATRERSPDMPAIAGSAAQERDPSRPRSAGEPSSAGAPCTRHSSAARSGSAGMAPWRLTASLTPGTRASLVEDAIPGCGLGALGSGSTLGIDWSEVTPYDSESVGSWHHAGSGRGQRSRTEGWIRGRRPCGRRT